MLRGVGSESSLGAAGQANQAGGVPSTSGGEVQDRFCRTVSSADLAGSSRSGYFDLTDILRGLGLADESLRVLVPSRSVESFDNAVAGLGASGFRFPLQRPFTQAEFNQVNCLVGIGAISSEIARQMLSQNHALLLAARSGPPASGQAASSQGDQGASGSMPRTGSMSGAALARPASQPNLNSQGTGANRSGASGQRSSAATSSLPQGTQPSSSQVPRSQSAAPRAQRSGSRANLAAGTDGGRAPLSSSAAGTDERRGNAAGVLNVEPNNGGVNPHNERRSIMSRIKGSDYFPQRGLSWVFAGAVGYSGYWVAERMMYVSVKMQDPKIARSSLVTSMLAPFIIFGILMRVYMQLNKETKHIVKMETMENRLAKLEAGRNPSQAEAAAETAGAHNV